jgi:periplasmic protein TonB
MFEYIKQNDRPNTMKYYASLLLSVMVHAAILCAIVTVPLIFCNALNPGDFLTWMITPSAMPPAISPPAPHYSASARTGGGGGGGHPLLIKDLTVPKTMPDSIVLEPPPNDFVVDWAGNKPGNGPGTGLGDGNSPIGSSSWNRILARPNIQEPPVPITKPPAKQVPIIPSHLQASKLIYKVVPVYPHLAVLSRVSGTVILMARIDEEGNVVDLNVVSGHPLLRDAAIQAVKQWKYSPTVLNGDPMPVQATVNVIFTLK